MIKERPVCSSIYLENSKFQELSKIALERGYRSRNELIAVILTNWLEKDQRKNKK